MEFLTLRLGGFKSFVDPTELPLAPGLTGIVGPNGCGKSNILEAIRWVMGESSAKSMRGDGMEDVIFAGTSSRAARNFAEVSLQVDNSGRTAPAQYNAHDSLEVSRRITRNAGSVFRVNGKETRARDVRVLFADAATGSQSPALVRQGQIGLLIAAKPQGRRKILEDAAGVSGLYERRREVEQKLRAAEENLLRVDDVLARLDSQIGSLRRQARQAEKYQALTEEIREAEAELLWLRHSEAQAVLDAARAALLETRNRSAAAEAARNAAEAARNETVQALPPLREELSVAQALDARFAARRDAQDAETRHAEETVRRLRDELRRLETDLAREAELRDDADRALSELQRERAALGAGNSNSEAIAEAEAALAAAETALASAETRREELSNRLASDTARREAVEREAREARRTLEQAESRHRETAERLERVSVETSELDQRLDTEKEERKAAAVTLAPLPRRLGEAEANRSRAENASSDARTALAAARAEAAALEAERKALERALEADSDATPEDALVNRVKVAPGYEAAFAAALGDEVSVGETKAFSTKLRGWLALRLLSHTPDSGEPLAKRVEAPDALARRIAATAIVSREDGPAAQKRLKPGQRLVSPEGDLWRWDGFFAGASANGADAVAARVARRNRLAAVTEADLAAQAALTRCESQAGEAIDSEKSARASEVELRRELDQAQKRFAKAERAAEEVEAALARNAESRAALGEETARLAKLLGEAQERDALARKEAQSIADPAELRAEAATAKTELGALRRIQDEARASLASLRSETTRRADRAEKIAREVEGWERRTAGTTERQTTLETRLERCRAELNDAEAEPQRLAEARAAMATEIAATGSRLAQARAALEAAEAHAAEAADRSSEAARRLATERESLARHEAVAESAAQQAESALAALIEETRSTPEALKERFADREPTSAQQVETRLVAARASRERLGAVNLRAAIEIGEAETERASLGAEKSDLEGAIAKLRTGLSALNREGRERLLDAFDRVNAQFQDLFRHLFGGGEAELRLTESDDPLEAGLEIFCQPPGKKLQTLSLLSGGEQTLTALALIFGVFLVNPAPVCVLDEVDAPLDDANVGRFCDLLDAMRARTGTRYLIITHHAVTMARMDRLFGVTMVERGVSRLVSVDLGAAVDLAEAAVS